METYNSDHGVVLRDMSHCLEYGHFSFGSVRIFFYGWQLWEVSDVFLRAFKQTATITHL